MATRARNAQQRVGSFVVKIETEVMSDAERLARAARIARDEYITHALRHYNRFHAMTKRARVRHLNIEPSVVLFPVAAAQRSTGTTTKHRKRS